MYALIDYALKLFAVSEGRSKKGHSASVSLLCFLTAVVCSTHPALNPRLFQSAFGDCLKILATHQNNLQETAVSKLVYCDTGKDFSPNLGAGSIFWYF